MQVICILEKITCNKDDWKIKKRGSIRPIQIQLSQLVDLGRGLCVLSSEIDWKSLEVHFRNRRIGDGNNNELYHQGLPIIMWLKPL